MLRDSTGDVLVRVPFLGRFEEESVGSFIATLLDRMPGAVELSLKVPLAIVPLN